MSVCEREKARERERERERDGERVRAGESERVNNLEERGGNNLIGSRKAES